MDDKIPRWEYLFDIGYLLFLVSRVIKISTLQELIPVESKVSWGIRIITLGLIVMKWCIYRKFRARNIHIVIAVLVFSFVQGIINRNTVLFDIVLLVILSEGIQLKTILKRYVFIVGTMTCVIITLSLSGVIENYAFNSEDARGIRYAFGYIYATDFATLFLMLQIAVSLVFKFGKSVYFMALSIAVGGLIYFYTDARTGFALTVLYAVMRWALPRLAIAPRSIKGLPLIMPLAAGTTFLMSMCYVPGNFWWDNLNKLLSGRIALGQRALQEVGISVWGQAVTMRGNGWNGGEVLPTDLDYFIDSSYLQLGILYGIVALMAVVIAHYIYVKYAVKKDKLMLILALLFISVSAMVEHHLLEVVYNPFIFVIGALWLSPLEIYRSIELVE
ncbi:hypothetical protein NHG24_01530 [Aerococcaceae bacterium NML210727]|nr:hypothetical protein [Aerococcaceae bacterium NML210727]MCW6654804.1 hypothetical protein [Aerococcaceae bacterium NML201296]